MADLYGTKRRSSSLESEEMSSLLHTLLHNSSTKNMHSFSSSSQPPPPVVEEASSTAGLARLSSAILFDSDFRRRDGASTAVVNSSSNLNFSDPGDFFPTEAKESMRNSFSSAGAADSNPITSYMNTREFPPENDVDDDDDEDDFGFGFERPKASEVPANPIPQRSSKRTRAAEIHNLSEKRRRSRINEKLKALQNLIPNSNKTDKASMLDEAIEYLKQLQLQVQMLTMRNGLSLHPVYLPETLQPVQLPQRGVNYDEGNGLLSANRGDTFSGNQEFSTQAALYISNHTPLNQPIAIPSVTNISNSANSFGLEPSIRN